MSAIFQDEIIYGAVAPSPINDGSTSTSEVWSGDYLSTKFSEVNSNLGQKLDKSSVVNNLKSTSTTSPLSANQGKVLNDKLTKYKVYTITTNLTANSTNKIEFDLPSDFNNYITANVIRAYPTQSWNNAFVTVVDITPTPTGKLSVELFTGATQSYALAIRLLYN